MDLTDVVYGACVHYLSLSYTIELILIPSGQLRANASYTHALPKPSAYLSLGKSVPVITSSHSVKFAKDFSQAAVMALKQSLPSGRVAGKGRPAATPSPLMTSTMVSTPFTGSPGWLPLTPVRRPNEIVPSGGEQMVTYPHSAR